MVLDKTWEKESLGSLIVWRLGTSIFNYFSENSIYFLKWVYRNYRNCIVLQRLMLIGGDLFIDVSSLSSHFALWVNMIHRSPFHRVNPYRVWSISITEDLLKWAYSKRNKEYFPWLWLMKRQKRRSPIQSIADLEDLNGESAEM